MSRASPSYGHPGEGLEWDGDVRFCGRLSLQKIDILLLAYVLEDGGPLELALSNGSGLACGLAVPAVANTEQSRLVVTMASTAPPKSAQPLCNGSPILCPVSPREGQGGR